MYSKFTMLSANELEPPELSITIPEKRNLSTAFMHWGDFELPIDILLLTVKDCEFLACYFFLRKPFRSYLKELGYMYFGEMGQREGTKPLQIVLITCSEGATQPGGTLIKVKNAVEILLPKAVFCVGCCGALNREKTKLKLGDVVVSSKLTTYADKTVTDTGVQPRGLSAPVGRDIAGLIRHAADGWVAPLKNTEARKVNVHCSGEFLSGPEEIDSNTRREELVELYPNAIAVEMDGQGMVIAVLFDCLVLSRNSRQNYTHDVSQRNMDSGLRTPDSGLRTPDSGNYPESGNQKKNTGSSNTRKIRCIVLFCQ